MNYAYVTLATNDSYALGALVLGHTLHRVGTLHTLVVLVTPGVTANMRDNLSSVFDLVAEVDILDSKDTANLMLLQRPELGVTFTKLHCWRLTQFQKCVFLDADTMVLDNVDELFQREELSAAPDVGWPDCFNSGVFVYCPSEETYNNLIKLALAKGSFDGGDQGLLNQYFSTWAHADINKHLPFIYNMCSTAGYSYLPAYKQYGNLAKIVHFIGNAKPWLQYFDAQTRRVAVTPGLEHLEDLIQKWWNLFCCLVHPSLSPDMSGLAGALAQVTLGEPRTPQQTLLEDHLRRQCWESGNVDYMGRDSFDHIWGKICETIETPPPPATYDIGHSPPMGPLEATFPASLLDSDEGSGANGASEKEMPKTEDKLHIATKIEDHHSTDSLPKANVEPIITDTNEPTKESPVSVIASVAADTTSKTVDSSATVSSTILAEAKEALPCTKQLNPVAATSTVEVGELCITSVPPEGPTNLNETTTSGDLTGVCTKPNQKTISVESKESTETVTDISVKSSSTSEAISEVKPVSVSHVPLAVAEICAGTNLVPVESPKSEEPIGSAVKSFVAVSKDGSVPPQKPPTAIEALPKETAPQKGQAAGHKEKSAAVKPEVSQPTTTKPSVEPAGAATPVAPPRKSGGVAGEKKKAGKGKK